MLHPLHLIFVAITIGLIAVPPLINGENCDKLYGSQDSFVCICMDASCSTIGTVDPPTSGNFKIVTTSRDEHRFLISELPLTNISTAPSNFTTSISIDASLRRQSIIGYGGAFTDATGINIATLNPIMQETLIRHYFAPEGIEYNIGRVPIAGSDFSTRPYSYDDVEGDIDLQFFNLTEEDFLYKIPYIKMAQSVSQKDIKLFASPWAPPSWMKTNGMVNGTGSLLPEMQQPWADYFVKFFESYKQENLSFWGVTAQNEPTQGIVDDHKWNACGFNASYMRDFVRDFLGPTLKASEFANVKLMINDDSREALPWYPATILNDTVANSYVDGVAVHWYIDVLPSSSLDEVNSMFPDKFMLYTEACNIPKNLQHENAVKLGSWGYGDNYAYDIIEDMNHWVSGWVDWNMVLDSIGGPNWVANYVDAPIFVSEDGREFYKEPMFYAMGHFSKFIPEGSVSMVTNVAEVDPNPLRGNIFATSVITPSDQTVVVVLSRNDIPELLRVEDTNGNILSVTIPPMSINTIIY